MGEEATDERDMARVAYGVAVGMEGHGELKSDDGRDPRQAFDGQRVGIAPLHAGDPSMIRADPPSDLAKAQAGLSPSIGERDDRSVR